MYQVRSLVKKSCFCFVLFSFIFERSFLQTVLLSNGHYSESSLLEIFTDLCFRRGTAYFSHSQNKFTTHGVLANQRTAFTEWRHPLTAVFTRIRRPDQADQTLQNWIFPIMHYVSWFRNNLWTKMKVWACQHFFQQENWPNGTVSVIFSNRHMARCFLHYLVILSIRLSDQNVQFRIKILTKITVT